MLEVSCRLVVAEFGLNTVRLVAAFSFRISDSCKISYRRNIIWSFEPTHRDNGGSGAGVLGHPPARKARRRVLKPPSPERPVVPVCVRLTGLPQNYFLF